ncbi:RNA recognition motif domain-containing protein [Hamiltosporidium tvaerminnensis]|uniref:RNA recognition motif domain-containing protein n=1 Tax=Hamiltosporidium tvaerminnensis TaxID=1176355 RepID=A0A4Q9M3H3_9MICR|nr:hypothetical protein LUQ84_001762 [Hamiltosporidium tvaerminnensis]TBU20262.1 RNA recognition motif domain-containing protein [Hamiltosporidium tvaerminnensis]
MARGRPVKKQESSESEQSNDTSCSSSEQSSASVSASGSVSEQEVVSTKKGVQAASCSESGSSESCSASGCESGSSATETDSEDSGDSDSDSSTATESVETKSELPKGGKPAVCEKIEVESNESSTEKSEKDSEEENSKSASDVSSEDEKLSSSEKSEKNDEILSEEEKNRRTIFIKGLSESANESSLRKELQKNGKVVDIRIPKDSRSGKNKGYAYIQFSKESEATSALKLNGKKLLGTEVVVDNAKMKNRNEGGDGNTLFVRGIPFECSEDKLNKYMSKFGEVLSVSIPKDRENINRNKGFCFVSFKEASVAEKVVKSNLVFEDRKLSCEKKMGENKFGNKNNNSGFRDKKRENMRNTGGNGFKNNRRDSKGFDNKNKRVRFRDNDSD